MSLDKLLKKRILWYINVHFQQFKKKIQQYIRRNNELKNFITTKEFKIIAFFWFLFFVIVARLFYLQVILADYYDNVLQLQHVRATTLQADRWHIYVTDRSNKEIKLTENITLYNLFIDPEFVKDKDKLINVLSPLIYYHLCKLNWFTQPDNQRCIENVERFAQTTLLPKKPEIFYYASWVVSNNFYSFDRSWYNNMIIQQLSWFTQDVAMWIIADRLDDMIIQWFKEFNYLWYIDNQQLISFLLEQNRPFISIYNWNYLYINYDQIGNRTNAQRQLTDALELYWYKELIERLPWAFERQKHRYVRIITNVNPLIAQTIERLKSEYYYDRTDSIPLLHWVWLESYIQRYYPYNNFMSHTLWYVNRNWEAFYGIESYFDDILKGKDWRIEWRWSAWIWSIWANDFKIDDVENWFDVYLTIDPGMQKEIEKIAQQFKYEFDADNISILVYDPYSWHVKSSVTYPDFNPNSYQDAFLLKPLSIEDRDILDDETKVDIPVYMKNWDEIIDVTRSEDRFTSLNPKYIFRNRYWPTALIDKNIAFPSDPWSVFKTITFAIGLDTNEISRYEFYEDPEWSVKIDEYTIWNAAEKCTWTHNFLFALKFSCNVWMVRIVQRLTKFVFYNYVEKLWFWKLTNIELAWEAPWFVDTVNNVSTARFLNNSFWLWMFATPIQLAAAYGAILNEGKLMKTTVIDKICDPNKNQCFTNQPKILRQVFTPDISDKIKDSLVELVNEKDHEMLRVPWYSVGWKSWTASLVYKWVYKEWEWRTNWAFVWFVTRDDTKYIIVVEVRRPRKPNQRWVWTAWVAFREVAKFLIGYEMIDW